MATMPDIEMRVTGAEEARAQLLQVLRRTRWQRFIAMVARFMWKGRYFLTYFATLGVLLAAVLYAGLDGSTFAGTIAGLFAVLCGGGAAVKLGAQAVQKVTGKTPAEKQEEAGDRAP